ncbi:hypothetical protein K0M31_020256 [Melipona bicolor]|uniref:Uncharacterized protein n=1 Tax=Melipona bicolor TaxID=60889 RepID=A0AA40G132_9HYME|nr:hypothetical protein K0M31_020256 [Melipona bicolor]
MPAVVPSTMNGSIIDKLPYYGILSESSISPRAGKHCVDNANSNRDTGKIFGTLRASQTNTTLFYLFAVINLMAYSTVYIALPYFALSIHGFQKDGGGLRRSVGVTIPFYIGTLEYGPIRAQDPRSPWQGLVSCLHGVGLAGGRVRGMTSERGCPGSPQRLETSRRIWRELRTEFPELPDEFLPRQDEAHFHSSLTAC